jgi:TetR/AcrR family transcriptional repressor of nem operon
MRVSQAEMDKSHAKILAGAARLLRERGIENTSVADVMGEAGMKNGGFYRHFDSKEALVDAAIRAAFSQMVGFVEGRMAEISPAEVASRYREYYLSAAHVAGPGNGCPVAALSGDVARAPDDLKASFGEGVNQMVNTLAKGMPGEGPEQRQRAIREFAMMAGAVAIARACDPETALAVLSACGAEC